MSGACQDCGSGPYDPVQEPCPSCTVTYRLEPLRLSEVCVDCGGEPHSLRCGLCGKRQPCRLHGRTGPRRPYCTPCVRLVAW